MAMADINKICPSNSKHKQKWQQQQTQQQCLSVLGLIKGAQASFSAEEGGLLEALRAAFPSCVDSRCLFVSPLIPGVAR